MRPHSGARVPGARNVAFATALGWFVGLGMPALVVAASPSPTAAAAGDPRSSGAGPGLVGDPLWAFAIVVAIAVVSLLGTLAYVRATAGRNRDTGG